MADASPLLQRYPRLASHCPWTPLGCWPTPVARLARLSEQLHSELWIKRDDVSAEIYGGNKVRKLEHLLAQATERGCHQVVTVGGMGSNHMIATALHAARLGLRTTAVVVPQPPTPHARHNLELARRLQVELVPCPNRALAPAYLAARGQRPGALLVGPGGSSPLGTMGYVAAGLELAQQVRAQELPAPDEIYLPLGSGGTLAGLALGLALAGLPTVVVGVAVVERVLANAALVRLLLHRCRRLLRRAGVQQVPAPASVRFRVVHGYVGRCYGALTAAGAEADRLAQRLEGLQLDSTYTAKCMAALVDACRAAPRLRRLFWHTFNSRSLDSLAVDEAPPLPRAIRRWLRQPPPPSPA